MFIHIIVSTHFLSTAWTYQAEIIIIYNLRQSVEAKKKKIHIHSTAIQWKDLVIYAIFLVLG